jgi:hypothetical protein
LRKRELFEVCEIPAHEGKNRQDSMGARVVENVDGMLGMRIGGGMTEIEVKEESMGLSV